MGTRLLALFIALICVIAANNSEGTRKLAQSCAGNGGSLDAKEMNKHLAARAGNLCTKDSNLFETRTVMNKETIFDCHRENNLLASTVKHTFLSKKLFSITESIPRRYLRHKNQRHHRFLATAALPPGKKAPSPTHQSPSPSPSPSPMSEPSDMVGPTPWPLAVDEPSILPKNVLPGRRAHGDDNDDNQKYMLAGIVVVLVMGLVIVALLLFICLKRKKRVELKEGKRDEKPLLNFTISDVSAGSSGHTLSNPSDKDLAKAPSAANSDPSRADFLPKEAHSEGKNVNELPLPPGRKPLLAPPPGPPPPPPPPKPPAPAPPPPPKIGRRPPPPNPPGPAKPSPLGPHHRRSSTGEASNGSDESEAPKTKLKPFFWDKVLASPNHSMVWHEIKAGSFQFNEEMMEMLFGYTPADKNKNDHKKDSSSFESPQFIQIIDPKKSQNLAILLKALNVTTEEVCDALTEGNELPSELIQTLLRMAPTADEELKLRLYGGDIAHLGPAERFLKVMVDIPFAFKRLDALFFVTTFQEDFSSTKESLETLEVACKELRSSRLFLKLLEAVLKTGNRMNDGTYRGGAQAFKLDTLLKLSDVKGMDGKTTLLHFVVQEIIRSEGIRAARQLRESRSMSSVKTEDLSIDDPSNESEEYHRALGLQVVSDLSSELHNVKKAALVDNESSIETVRRLGQALGQTKAFLEGEMKGVEEEEGGFREALAGFVGQCESDIEWLTNEEQRITALVRSTGDYFHGRAGRDEGAHLFVIVRDFLVMLDKACLDVKSSSRVVVQAKAGLRKETAVVSPPPAGREYPAESVIEINRRMFPAMRKRQLDDDFSSEDES